MGNYSLAVWELLLWPDDAIRTATATININSMLPSRIYVLLDDLLYSPNRRTPQKVLTSGSACLINTYIVQIVKWFNSLLNLVLLGWFLLSFSVVMLMINKVLWILFKSLKLMYFKYKDFIMQNNYMIQWQCKQVLQCHCISIKFLFFYNETNLDSICRCVSCSLTTHKLEAIPKTTKETSQQGPDSSIRVFQISLQWWLW